MTPPTRCICQVSNWYLKTCRKKARKTFRWLGALVTPPFKCFCPPEGQKLPNHDENHHGSRHSQYKCVYQIWGLYMIFKAINADKWLWPIFGCKVGQSVPIETRTWRVTPPTACIYQVSNWYLKTCRKKARKTTKNPKRTKIIAKILKIIFWQKTELMSNSIQQATCVPNLKNLSWFMRPWLQKIGLTYFWL